MIISVSAAAEAIWVSGVCQFSISEYIWDLYPLNTFSKTTVFS